jgi:HEAT repeat protein
LTGDLESSLGGETGLLLHDLASVGYFYSSVSELRVSRLRYREAIPVLIEWFSRTSDPALKGEIVRALSVPWAKPAATPVMIEGFRSLDPSLDGSGTGLRWTIGNAIYVLGDDSVFDDLVELATDRKYGRARQMIVLKLGKLKRPEVVDVLLGLIDDPTVDGHAIDALAGLKVESARSALEGKLDDRRAWVRRAANRGLANLDRQSA